MHNALFNQFFDLTKLYQIQSLKLNRYLPINPSIRKSLSYLCNRLHNYNNTFFRLVNTQIKI